MAADPPLLAPADCTGSLTTCGNILDSILIYTWGGGILGAPSSGCEKPAAAAELATCGGGFARCCASAEWLRASLSSCLKMPTSSPLRGAGTCWGAGLVYKRAKEAAENCGNCGGWLPLRGGGCCLGGWRKGEGRGCTRARTQSLRLLLHTMSVLTLVHLWRGHLLCICMGPHVPAGSVLY